MIGYPIIRPKAGYRFAIQSGFKTTNMGLELRTLSKDCERFATYRFHSPFARGIDTKHSQINLSHLEIIDIGTLCALRIYPPNRPFGSERHFSHSTEKCYGNFNFIG